MQVALLDVMVQREEGLKRGKERMAAALDDMVAQGKAEYTTPLGQAAAREPEPKRDGMPRLAKLSMSPLSARQP